MREKKTLQHPNFMSIFRKSRFHRPWLPSTTWCYRSLLKDRRLAANVCPPVIAPLTESTPKWVPGEHYNVTTGHIKRIRALRAKEKKSEIKALVLTTNSALCMSYQADRLTTRYRDTT